MAGRLLGHMVAIQAWQKAQRYFDGTVRGRVQDRAMTPLASLESESKNNGAAVIE